MTRYVAVCAAAVVAVLALGGAAHAQGTLPNGATITFERVFIHEDGDVDGKEPSNPDALWQYFNLAHCVCGQSMPESVQATFDYELKVSADTGLSRSVDFYVGTNCNDDLQRPTTCLPIDSAKVSDVDNLLTPDRVSFPIYDIVNVKTAGACRQEAITTLLWAMVDTDGNGTYDYWVTQEVPKIGTTLTDAGVDTLPPPALTELSASGSESSIEVSWSIPEGREDDFYVYQAFCSKVDDSPGKTEDVPEKKYETPMDLCGAAGAFALTPVDLPPSSDGDVAVGTLPGSFAALDEAFLCGEQAGATAKSLTINGLENGTQYKVALVAVDRSGNASGTYFTRTVTPKPVIDFWEDLNSRDDGIKGGCLLAETYGDDSALTRGLRAFRDGTLARSAPGRALIDAYYATLGKLGPVVHRSVALRAIAAIALAPLVAIALAWHALSLPGLLFLLALPWLWRRRRALRPRLAMAAAIAACWIVPRVAAADDFTPYWEDPDHEAAALREGYDEVKWHVGIRVGPYIPDIDIQFGLNALTGQGPYEAMFGNYYLDDKLHKRKVWQVMPMLDVDRVLWDGFGQLLVGGELGYMQKTAKTYLDGTTEDTPMRPRSGASSTGFHLIPFALTATYRLTYLDDAYGIPIVPYVKGGLSYYAWWISGPNKTFTESCTGSGDDEMCDTGRGGSFGFQGSIGLSLRAERIDAAAAMSMRNSGIQHAGFYAELFWAKVDGFGSSSRLSVGDTTWFAGVDFEF